MHLMLLTVGLLSFVSFIWWFTRRRTRYVTPITSELHDEVLGVCTVQHAVNSQSTSRFGWVKFEKSIRGSLCEFSCSFDESSDISHGVAKAVQQLRQFYAFVTHPERSKLYRNALLDVIDFHVTLYPEDRFPVDELRETAQLRRVEVINEGALLTFQAMNFLRGRPIKVRITEVGDVDFVGVG